MSVVAGVIDHLSTRLEALAPPDRRSITYHRLEGKQAAGAETWMARGFQVGLPTLIEVSLENAAVRLTRWAFDLIVVFDQTGRGVHELPTAISDELALISAHINSIVDWPASTEVVFVDSAEVVEGEVDGTDHLLRFMVQADTWEAAAPGENT